ncbi:MAG: hypothetical protein RL385_5225 [Pseudomonadota bacterium]|jgi:hypothetical protein
MKLTNRRFYVLSHERSGTHFLINTLSKNLWVPDGNYYSVPDWFGGNRNGLRRHLRYQQSLLAQRLRPKQNGLIKSHPDRELFESCYWKYPVVYIVRDPRDALVSFWHHQRDPSSEAYIRRHNAQFSAHRFERFSDFLRAPLSDFLKYTFSLRGDFANVAERLAKHVAGWRAASNALVVRYEDLKAEPERIVEMVSQHLGIPRTREVRQVGVREMSSILPRKGVVGDFRNYLTAKDEAFLRAAWEAQGLSWEEDTLPAERFRQVALP